MTPVNELLSQLLDQAELAAQIELLKNHIPQLNQDQTNLLAEALKDAADLQLRSDAKRSLDLAHLLYHLAELTQHPFYRALGLFAEANACAIGGLGQYERAISLCDEAAAIYSRAGQPVDQADAQVTKIYAHTMLGRHAEALKAGEWAIHVLNEHQEWMRLATVYMNVAIVYGRKGRDADALAHFERAGALYGQVGEAGEWSLPGVEMNRALVLRNLGRFDESLAANERAIQLLTTLEQYAEVGHAQQTMAFTYYVLGRYNEALELLQRAHTLFATYERPTDLLLTDLYMSQCLLGARRFAQVIQVCSRVADGAAQVGQRFEEGHALLNKATAFIELAQQEQALDLLTAARAVFVSAGNPQWAARVELEAARVQLLRGHPSQALTLAERCAAAFAVHQTPVQEAEAQLIIGQALLALNRPAEARRVAASVLTLSDSKQLFALSYRGHHLLGRAAAATAELATAGIHYAEAIAQVERLRSRLMLEFRTSYVEDKMAVYEDAIALCLQQEQVEQAFSYVERAQSRGLHDLLAQRLDLRIQARHPLDQPLVAELTALQGEHDRLLRRAMHEQGFAPAAVDASPADPNELADLEEQITERWHALLIQNADYAREAAQWQPLLEPVQPLLEADSLLLQYYVMPDRLLLFLVTCQTLQVVTLPTSAAQAGRLIELYWRNLKMVAHSAPEQVRGLTRHVQRILHQLYQLLLAPVEPALKAARRLILVPHGILHYAPFQALQAEAESNRYLIDSHEISYLPGASFLHHALHAVPCGAGVVAFGHSYGGALPHTVTEATAVARMTGGSAYLEETVTKVNLQKAAASARLLHLAAHGDFRVDNPLFSGLALADGRMTTLDIFNLRTSASLVTLSACQTGRSTLGGGDELLGIMRAFLAAGAASLLLTMWPVHDASTEQLMTHFYQALWAGKEKGAALRTAQIALRESSEAYKHPYHWAPFILVGATGVL